MNSRIEVVARLSGRRAWTIEQKLAMLRDAFGPGGSVRTSIERHEVSIGLLTPGDGRRCRVSWRARRIDWRRPERAWRPSLAG